jgi:hypothetical protein
MKFLVFGNINAGKSTVIESLRKQLPAWPAMQIDEFRRKHGDGTWEGDNRAMEEFCEAVAQADEAIVECTGLGPLGRKLKNKVPPKQAAILWVTAPLNVCLERVNLKDLGSVPYPPSPEPIEATIARCHAEFARGDLDDLWQDHVLWTFELQGDDDVDQAAPLALPLRQLDVMSRIVSAVQEMSEVDALIWLGSGARGTMDAKSDIDLFAWTSLAPEVLAGRVVAAVDGCRLCQTLGSKFALWFEDFTLVEITCSETLSDIDEFYRESRIRNVNRSLLKGPKVVLEHLEGASLERVHASARIYPLVEKLTYFLASLPGIMDRGDRYKYFFHANIVIHTLIQIRALTAGDDFLLHLPRHALRHVDDELARKIWFTPDADYYAHFPVLIEAVRDALRTVPALQMDTSRHVRFVEDQATRLRRDTPDGRSIFG